MGVLKEQICVNQKGREITSQFVIEEDYNVPDSKADIGRIVMGEGKVKIEDIKPSDNYLNVVGKLQFKILYVTDSAEPVLASMEGQIPMEEMIYVEGEGKEDYHIQIKRVHFLANMIHSRKIEIRAVCEMGVHWERTCMEEVATSIVAEVPVFQKVDSMEILELHDKKRDIYRIREEFPLSGTKDNIEQIIWEKVELRKLDSKMLTDALQLNGELQVFCIYRTQENKIDWIEQSVPFEGQITCQGADTGFYYHMNRELSEVQVEPRMDEDGEMRVLGIDAVLEMRIHIYKEEKRELLQDAYCLEMKYETQKKRVFLEKLLMQSHSRHRLIERLEIPEMKEEILQICHASGELQIEKTEITAGGILVEGILHVKFLYVKANDHIPFDIWTGMIPFSYLIECDVLGLNTQYDITCSIEQIAIELVGSGEIEVKAYLAFQSFLGEPVHRELISEIILTPADKSKNEKTPGMIGYLVKREDELWDLAKKYETTEESIAEINGLSSKILKEGEKILILKENMSIL